MTASSIDGQRFHAPRVLHLYRRFHPDFTGDGIYYQQLIPVLERKGSTHDILAIETTPPDEGNAVKKHPSENYRVFYFTEEVHNPSLYNLCSWLLKNRNKYDILHVHTHIDRYFVLYLLARLLGWRVIFSCTLNDSPSHLLESYRPHYRPLVQWLLRSINTFVAISPLLRDGITAVLPTEQARLIPQGVRIPDLPGAEQRAEYRRHHRIGKRTIVLVYVGSISARKNVAFLVRQMPFLLERHADMKLIIVGPELEQDYADQVKQFVHDHDLRERVLLTGYREDPSEFYTIGDIFVFASESEGFGNVLLEAMIAGLPVVSSQLDGVTDYFIRPGETGFLFRTEDEYRAQLLRLIEDPALRRDIARRGQTAVHRNFSLDAIAQRYADLYDDLVAGDTAQAPGQGSGRVRMVGCSTMNGGPATVGMLPVDGGAGQPPILNVVIDTEAEFDWSRGVIADRGSVTAIPSLALAQDLFDGFGVKPCYVVDYPVASHADSAQVMREMRARGAEIGAHLQPWTTPPLEEPLDQWHAYPGNLDAELERRKLATLMETIQRTIGVSPTVYKAGRYGLSRNTLALLEELGFEVDLSIGSAFDFRGEGGPDYTAYGSVPYIFGAGRQLLALPTTGGYTGLLRRVGAPIWQASARPLARAVHFRGVLDRLHGLSRVRLSPEGHHVGQLAELTRGLLDDGVRVFTMSFHSSSMKPGFTPYVRTEADLAALTDTMRRYFEFFLGELGGVALTPTETKRSLLGL